MEDGVRMAGDLLLPGGFRSPDGVDLVTPLCQVPPLPRQAPPND